MRKGVWSIKSLCFSAIIAALYAALTLAFQPLSFGAVQFRFSEAMTLLPLLFPQSIPGLVVGCLISNLIGSTPWDAVFGTLATLLAALTTYQLRRNIWLAAAAPVVFNAVIIGLLLHFTLGIPLLPTMLSVGFGEAVVVYIAGILLIKGISRIKLPQWLE